ncbi:hypothetical protein RhiJN_14411 [Ceratobasidium sp. AG-Ba]|nr:hypothetical protein RhiJN_14411 [Ceratobasidium sp. AG-Ba]
MSWANVVLPLVFILSAAFLLKLSYNSRWNAYTRLKLLQQPSISGGVLPPRPSFRRRKNASTTSRISYAATAFTRDRALRSFSRYDALARSELSSKRRGLSTLRGRHGRIADEVGYGEKLDRFEASIEVNSKVTKSITQFAFLEDKARVLGDNRIILYGASRWTDDGPTDLSRVVEALKHCVRDWSLDSFEERARVFAPILDVLAKVPPSQRKDTKVLVPGAGLGRLAWEIARMGFDVTANEVSSYMTLPLKVLLSDEITPTLNHHTVSPHSSWFSHTRSNDTLFQSASFPDILPRTDPNGMLIEPDRAGEAAQDQGSSTMYMPGGKFGLVESDFLSLVPPDRDDPQYSYAHNAFQNGLPSIVTAQPRDRGYDFVVTLFFIDTATNVLAYLDQIYALLRPVPSSLSHSSQFGAGTWINLGPLLWPSGAVLEPSLEEVLAMSSRVGLDVVGESPGREPLTTNGEAKPDNIEIDPLEARRTLECQYTANRAGMMKWMYQAEFWVAKRRED